MFILYSDGKLGVICRRKVPMGIFSFFFPPWFSSSPLFGGFGDLIFSRSRERLSELSHLLNVISASKVWIADMGVLQSHLDCQDLKNWSAPCSLFAAGFLLKIVCRFDLIFAVDEVYIPRYLSFYIPWSPDSKNNLPTIWSILIYFYVREYVNPDFRIWSWITDKLSDQ